MATRINTDGTTEEVLPRDGRSFTLEELYELVECSTVQAIYHPDGRIMWIDDEGKFADPPKATNAEASAFLYEAGGSPLDFVVGPVLITSDAEVE